MSQDSDHPGPAHVTFYEFNIENNQWSRKDVEGSLFVVKRNTQPRFQFIVMNRRNTVIYLSCLGLVFLLDVRAFDYLNNLVENLVGDFEYEVQVPYLLYRNAAQEVNGIWFYNSRECEEVANLFTRILNAYSKVPPKSKVASSKSELRNLKQSIYVGNGRGHWEPSLNVTYLPSEAPEDPSFVNYLAAMNIGGNTSNTANSRQSYPSSGTVPSSTYAPNVVSIFRTIATSTSPFPFSSLISTNTLAWYI
ncbi:hypothetical protein M0R45_029873 [Rubus argutus]|uniref:mRNA-decapping enzyme-like protein n=1 Tax=Rubus argutus TaxID=59490 RepID=A0AAW1WDJ9_RUBAR